MSRGLRLAAYFLVFAIQAGFLVSMLAARASVLANGTEVRLSVLPVDPRDFLRGDYVILSYSLSRLDSALLGGRDEFEYGAPIFVELTQQGDVWSPVALHAEKPENAVAIRGTVDSVTNVSECGSSSCAVYRASFNIEKFFVPEGEGLELERLRNNERVEVDVAIGSDGRALLKRLLVDGEIRYRETMF